MPFGDSSSAWWFYGRLRPAVATRFNVQEIEVQPGVRLEVLHDMIGVWARPGPWTIDGVREAEELFALVVGAYALITRIALDWSLDGWIEAERAQLAGATMGVIVDPRGHEVELPPDEEPSVSMRRAALLAVAVRDWPGYRLALRDVHAAYHTRSDDSFVFAYRAVEDVARGMSLRIGDLTPKDWANLHRVLETTKERFVDGYVGDLKAARDAVGHGDEVNVSGKERDRLIEIGRMVVAEALARDTVPFSLSYLRSYSRALRVPR